MICLNCGGKVSDHDTKCPSCNISLKKHGIIHQSNTMQPETEFEQNCHNCGASVPSAQEQCNQCNFPLKAKIFKPKPARDEAPNPGERPTPGEQSRSVEFRLYHAKSIFLDYEYFKNHNLNFIN
jgi:predicted amidophosphoribosyltransferase